MTKTKTRPRILVIGGRSDGIPQEIHRRFRVVKHVSREAGGKADRLHGVQVDYVFVIVNFSSHQMITRVRSQVDARFIYLPKGWPRMQERLLGLGILPDDPDVHPPASSALEGNCERRCQYPPCGRLWAPEKPFLFGIFCCKVCRNAAKRKGLKISAVSR